MKDILKQKDNFNKAVDKKRVQFNERAKVFQKDLGEKVSNITGSIGKAAVDLAKDGYNAAVDLAKDGYNAAIDGYNNMGPLIKGLPQDIKDLSKVFGDIITDVGLKPVNLAKSIGKLL